MCYLNRRVKNMCKNKKKIMERKQNYEGIILFFKIILKIIHVLIWSFDFKNVNFKHKTQILQ